MVQVPRVVVRTFSDSALLHTREEHTLDVFYEIALSLKHAIEKGAESPCCCIVNRDDQIAAPSRPPTGCMAFDDDGPIVLAYENIGGSGPAWVNLLYADSAVGTAKKWHGAFTLYCVGDRSISERYPPKDTIQFSGFAKVATNLHALA